MARPKMTEEKIIEAVRPYRELYDSQHPNYMKTKMKNRIWKDIATNLSLKKWDEAKTIWLKLRNSYRDARRRQTKCIKMGVSPENIKPWRFQMQMTFLEGCISTAHREGIVNDSDNDSQFSYALPVSNDILDFEAHQQYRIGKADPDSINEFGATDTLAQAMTLSSPSNYQKQGDVHSPLLRREEGIKSETGGGEGDPLYNFFFSMYQLTKKMPPQQQHKVRNQLFYAVSKSEEEIMNLNLPNHSAVDSSCQSSQGFEQDFHQPGSSNLTD